MKNISKEPQPASVPLAKQVGDVRSRWAWTEPSVWTDRMLETLEQGVKGGKWFSLCDKAFSVRCLSAAFKKVKANGGGAGVDHMTLRRFEENLERELPWLSEQLLSGRYQPMPLRRVWVPKPGSSEKRPLGIPTVRDRVVQAALVFALEPIFEKEFRDSSFGFRPNRSCHKALRRVWTGLCGGLSHVVDADLKNCFETISHGVILRGLEEKVSDGTLLSLVKACLKQGVMGEAPFREDSGTPQGAVMSPLLANVALHGLDCMAEEEGYELVRYADDFVLLCRSRQEAESALASVRNWTAGAGPTLHPDKTRIVDYGSGEPFEFLGYEFKKGMTFPRKKSYMKLKDKVRELTPRNAGQSLSAVVEALNPVLSGWFNYFRYSYKTAFPPVDTFVRQRLRAILLAQSGHGRFPNGRAMNRWPNAYFHNMGLFSTVQAHAKLQSSRLG